MAKPNKPTGPVPCKLCGDVATLHCSHILARALRKRAIACYPGERPPKLERVNYETEKSRFDDELPTDYLLCTNCEKRVQVDEDYMLTILHQPEPDPSVPWFDGAHVSGSQIGRFAVSILYRHAESRYATPNDALGAFREPIREHLLGRRLIPDDVFVCAILMNGGRLGYLSLPDCSDGDGFRVCRFHVCGVLFIVLLGAATPELLQLGCLARGAAALRDHTDVALRMMASAQARVHSDGASAEWKRKRGLPL